MQHPVGYRLGEDGVLHLENFSAYIFNPWALWQFAHNMAASLVTASFAVAAVGAYRSLMGQHARHAAICVRAGVITGLVSSLLVAFPTGDGQGKMVTKHQPVTLAAMEGLFNSGPDAELAIIGQPDVAARRLENPIVVPGLLSFLAYGTFGSTVHGLNDFPAREWPANLELLYYSYHIMVGLGTIFILVMGIAAVLLRRDRLTRTRPMLWVLMLAFPFPYIATTAGWCTAEMGRQPWIIQGLMRTANAHSELVNPGDVVFTTLGFAGLYLLLGMLFVVQVLKEIDRGPAPSH